MEDEAESQIKAFESLLKKREDELAEKHKAEINAYKDVNLETEQMLQAALKEVEEKNRFGLAVKKKFEDQKEETAELYEALETLKDNNKKLEEALSDTQSRLSNLIGDNNPDIADLSDINRPTKIGEKYQDLYDNQWTDAYEVAEEHFRDKEEKTRIRLLSRILMDIHKFCEEECAAQEKEFIHALYRTDEPSRCLPDIVKKQMKDMKRQTTADGIEIITKKFVQNAEKTTQLGNFIDEVREFVHECVSVCWPMVHQDPPLAFHPGVKIDEQFDSNKYQAYTVTGTVIDYVVWPALLLHQEGAVLTKGVVQYVKPLQGSKSLRSRSRQMSPSGMSIPTGSVRLTGKEATVNPSKWLQDERTGGNNFERSTDLTKDTITSQTSDLKDENTRTAYNVNQESFAAMDKTNSSKPTADGYSQPNTTQSVSNVQWSNTQQNQPSTFQQPQMSFNDRTGGQEPFAHHNSWSSSQNNVQTNQLTGNYFSYSVPTTHDYAWFEYYRQYYDVNSARQMMGVELYDRCKRYYGKSQCNQEDRKC